MDRMDNPKPTESLLGKLMTEKQKPRLETWGERTEVAAGDEDPLKVNISANQTVEIDKLYGPLCAHGVRIRLEYKGEKSDWVVESEDLSDGRGDNWIERARWDCQENFPEDDV